MPGTGKMCSLSGTEVLNLGVFVIPGSSLHRVSLYLGFPTSGSSLNRGL